MKIRSWSESSGAMLVPSTFTGWYKKTMMTRARPMAIKRSRVQTRISLRRECSGSGRSAPPVASDRSVRKFAVVWPAFATEGSAGVMVSGEVEAAGCFSSGRSIFGCLVFIAWPLRRAPDAIYHQASGGRGLPRFLTLIRFTERRHLLHAGAGYLPNGARVPGTGLGIDYWPSSA